MPVGTNRRRIAVAAVGATALMAALMVCAGAARSPSAGVYRSPTDAAFSPDGSRLAVADETAGEAVLIDPRTARVVGRFAAPGASGVAFGRDGRTLYVAARDAGALLAIDTRSRTTRRLVACAGPVQVALAQRRGIALVADMDRHQVVVARTTDGRVLARLDAGAEPFGLAVAPDESVAVVSPLRPDGDALRPENAASVRIVDLERLRVAAVVGLPAGSTILRDVAISPDGRWAYVAHVLGRFNLPTTQLDRGWVNTNALSIIDLRARKRYATVLLDHPSEGAADPWGLALAPNGSTAWVTLSGVHQIARLDLRELHRLMEGNVRPGTPAAVDSAEFRHTSLNTWLEIRRDRAKRELLTDDLTALHLAEVIERTPLAARGLRGIAVSPDGRTLAATAYFSGQVLLCDARRPARARSVSLGPARRPDAVRRGEEVFHDATRCFQHWLSCATCHPSGRADGLNWDLLNDGMGNPKNSRSLVLAYQTPPMMSHGVRDTMEVATKAGFRFILFREPNPRDLADTEAYIRSLRPRRSPYRRADGSLSPAARRGKALFEDPKVDCSRCHPAPLFTDLRAYDVGTRGPLDTGSLFDTPTLLETWRTGPFLHDGQARTMEEVLTRFNAKDQHGRTSHLTREQVRDLAEYVLSL
ncbi:MAG TPA: hypothetical protein VLH79_02110 [Chthonomonadales bacterium]|nr:hypothetical protein [Chthonomonadales bacterium]